MPARRPLAALFLGLAVTLPVAAQSDSEADQRRIAREMIQALDAYAVYKMGQFEEAYARYEALAEAGNHQGMLNLANMLAAGEGVERDPVQALAWYRRAAEDGSAIGMFEMGQAYEEGLGVTPDADTALDWYRRGAEADNADAQWQLGKHLYDRGQPLEGLAWIHRAARGGEQIAAQRFLEARGGEARPLQPVDDGQRAQVERLLTQLDEAARRRDAEAVVAPLAHDAQVRVRLPGSQAWTALSTNELRELWQRTFDRAEGYRYQREETDLLAADGGVLAVSRLAERFTSAGQETHLAIEQSALLQWENGQPRITSLRLDMRHPD